MSEELIEKIDALLKSSVPVYFVHPDTKALMPVVRYEPDWLEFPDDVSCTAEPVVWLQDTTCVALHNVQPSDFKCGTLFSLG